MSRIHSGGLPERHAALLAETLAAAGIEPVSRSTAEAAAGDDACVAFVGPFRSQDCALAAPVLNAAGIVHVAPAATWVGLTRDEPGSDPGVDALRPSGRPTLVRGAARDMVLCRALVANAPETRLAVVAEHEEYGRQLADQLRLAGLKEAAREEPEAVVYCGVGENAPHHLLAGRRTYVFDGAHWFGDAHTRYVLAVVPLDGFSDADVHAFVPQVHRAGALVARAFAQGGGDRESMLRAVWDLGGFDEHGDPPDPPVGVWRLATPGPDAASGGLIFETAW